MYRIFGVDSEYRSANRGMMTVELMIALFIWILFLSGIVSLWFGLFGPSVPFLKYMDQENFYVDATNGRDLAVPGSSMKYIDRNVQLFTGAGGLRSVLAEWKNSVGQRSCRGVSENTLRQMTASPIIDLDNANIASALLVRGNYLYLATNSSSTTDPDLYILSINDHLNPAVISKIDTGPGLTSLAAAGYRLFASNTSINSQAQAFDIADPSHSILKWSFKVPGSQGTSTASGKAIVSDGEHVFLGTAKNASSELFSLDAETGQLIADHEMSAGVNGLFLDHSQLYATSPIDPELLVFDVSSPSVMRQVGQYDAPGGSGNGKTIDIYNDQLFFGRTLGGNELSLLNLNRSSTSTEITKVADSKISGTIDALIAAKNRLFVLTSQAQKELQIWNIDANGNVLSLRQAIDLPSRAVGIGCSGPYVYVTLGSHIPLLIFKSE
jgi:hypothetical protein